VQGGIDEYLNSPEYHALTSTIDGLIAQPYTFGPGELDAMYQEGAGQAYSAANGAMDNLNAKQAANGVYRSGATENNQYQIASRMGEGLASAYRNAQVQNAQQRMQDRQQLISTVTTHLANKFGLRQSLAQAQMGQANVYTNVANVPTPAQQIFGGVGKLAGTAISAQGQAASGGGKLFG